MRIPRPERSVPSDRSPQAVNWNAAVASGAIRVAAGQLLIRLPGAVARLAGAAPDDRLMTNAVRALGVRDTALGVSALTATRPGRSARRQVYLQGAADVGDSALAAFAVYEGRLAKVRGIGCAGFALVSAGVHFAIARRLPPPT